MPEVVGEAGLLIEPDDVEGLSGAMQRVLEDSKLRAELVDKGFARAQLFSWKKTTDLMFSAWKEAANG